MSDLAIFYGKYIASLRDELNELKERNKESVEQVKMAREAHAIKVAEYRKKRDARIAREKLERKQRLKAENEAICIYLKEEPNDNLIKQSQFYDLPTFDSRYAKNQWELTFLRDMKVRLSNRESLTNAQVNTLYRIVNNTEPVTDKQLAYLKALGYEGNEPTTKAEASRLITEYKEE